MVRLIVSEAERQGTEVRILGSLLFFFVVVVCLFHYYFSFHISFHLFIIIIFFFLYAFYDLFPLLVSGVRVGRLCWVGQEPAVAMAVVWKYFSCHC